MTGQEFECICIDGKGLIVEGATLRKHAKANPFGYVSSINADNMATDKKLKQLSQSFTKMTRKKSKFCRVKDGSIILNYLIT